ncbi:MAG TPA: DUF1688 family protein [Xanthobacteraceae bacterium]|nr:DUF1688 family protein [Xanthobacteraceae bacterium]
MSGLADSALGLSAAGARDRRAALTLLNAAAVRERAGQVLAAGLDGRLDHFTMHADWLNAAAVIVADVVRTNYPDLVVPFHARWRHFVVSGRDLWHERVAASRWPDAGAQARAAFDLASVSVLLDAGAGDEWRYRDEATGVELGRSEGLALASLRMFEAGLFSADAADPLRADAERLMSLDAQMLAAGFQVGAANPLPGLDGRAALLVRLGRAVAGNPGVFARRETPRPGGLFDFLGAAWGGRLPAPRILEALLVHLAEIWPGRFTLGGVGLGDTWRHPAVKRADASDGMIPFHKLSQWLAYSLIEPLQQAGVAVVDIDGLTGLAEYRNGGLFVDAGVIALRDRAAAAPAHPVDAPLVVEWRALTVALLDRIAPLVRERLGVSEAAFPLARVLEGGTWAAGRRLARERRPDGSPPIRVASDGTVF